MTDFKKLAVMILAFVLLLLVVVTEVNEHFELSDFGMLIMVMAFVTVVPALGGQLFSWMNADNEDASVRKAVAEQRTKISMTVGIVLIIVLAGYEIYKYFLR